MQFHQAKPGDILKVPGLIGNVIKCQEQKGFNIVSADSDFKLGYIQPIAEVEKIGSVLHPPEIPNSVYGINFPCG